MPQTKHDLTVRLFGDVELENSLGCVTENRSRRSFSWLLLKYLLLNRGREVDSYELQNYLYIGEGEACDDAAMRVRLRRLREAVRPLGLDGRRGLVLYASGKYILNPSYEIHSDEHDFSRLLECLRGLPMNKPEGVDFCIKALEIMRGEYMQYTDNAPWLDAYRDYYRRELTWLTQNCLERSRALNNDRALALLCQRTAAICPENEQLHRSILVYLMERGREFEYLRYVSQLSRSNRADWMNKATELDTVTK